VELASGINAGVPVKLQSSMILPGIINGLLTAGKGTLVKVANAERVLWMRRDQLRPMGRRTACTNPNNRSPIFNLN
jgi:hypothetical protein